MKNKLFAILLIGCFFLSGCISAGKNSETSPETANNFKISFTFDDGYDGVYDYARDILSEANIEATAYITTDWVEDEGYMTWSEIASLEEAYNWEIGSHTLSHPWLTKISQSQLSFELAESKRILLDHNIDVKNFASPYGNVSWREYAEIAKYYFSERNVNCIDRTNYSDYSLCSSGILATHSPEEIITWIENAKENGRWIILCFHDIVENNAIEYEYNRSDLQAIVDYIQKNNYQTVTINDVIQQSTSSPNILYNPSFEIEMHWTEYWGKGGSDAISIDTGTNGCMPYPDNSLKITSSQDKHEAYFSPIDSINDSNTYVWKMYLNVENNSKDGTGAYIIEYDAEWNYLATTDLFTMYGSFVGTIQGKWNPAKDCSIAELYIYTEPSTTEGIYFTAYYDAIYLGLE